MFLLYELDHGEGIARVAKTFIVDRAALTLDMLDVAALVADGVLAHTALPDANGFWRTTL